MNSNIIDPFGVLDKFTDEYKVLLLESVVRTNGSIPMDSGYVPSVAGDVVVVDSNLLVPSSLLPSYVDDVIELATYADLPIIGESGKIYVVITDESTSSTNTQYRWTGTVYVRLGGAGLTPEQATELSMSVTFYPFGVDYSSAVEGDLRAVSDGRIYVLLVDGVGTAVWSSKSGLSTTSKYLVSTTVTTTSTLDTVSDIYLVDATSGNIVITLPNVENKVLNVYRDDATSNTITFTDAISNDNTFELLSDENLTVIKLNGKWRMI